jgi:hypothetical protein
MATREPADDDPVREANDLDPSQQEGQVLPSQDEPAVEGWDDVDDDDPDGLFLLLEENAKLRDLVVTLTDILLETFVDQGLTRQRAP